MFFHSGSVGFPRCGCAVRDTLFTLWDGWHCPKTIIVNHRESWFEKARKCNSETSASSAFHSMLATSDGKLFILLVWYMMFFSMVFPKMSSWCFPLILIVDFGHRLKGGSGRFSPYWVEPCLRLMRWVFYTAVHHRRIHGLTWWWRFQSACSASAPCSSSKTRCSLKFGRLFALSITVRFELMWWSCFWFLGAVKVYLNIQKHQADMTWTVYELWFNILKLVCIHTWLLPEFQSKVNFIQSKLVQDKCLAMIPQAWFLPFFTNKSDPNAGWRSQWAQSQHWNGENQWARWQGHKLFSFCIDVSSYLLTHDN